MKKTTKKLLTFALATLFVGAGFGAVTAYYNDANVIANAEETTTVDIANEIYNANVHGNGDWGTNGDYKEAGLYRFWLDEDKVLNWNDAGVATCLNESTYGYLLDYIKVNGKTISEWRTAYAAGETNAITWTGMPANEAPKPMQNNIVEDVNAGRAIYAPIFVVLVNHGGSYGSALDITIPYSFIAKDEVKSIEFLKGFEWNYNGQTFMFSENVKFAMSSIGRSGKLVGEFDNVIDTTVTAVDGSYGAGDKFLSFYLGTNDYGTMNTAALADKAFIRGINFMDYVLIDGEKMGATWGTDLPGEQFFGVWGRTGSFSTRWPSVIKNAGKADSVQTIKFLAGCQFPSANDTYNTVYEVKEDVTFVRMPDGSFANEALMIKNDQVTFSEAKDAGNQLELYEFTISYANWNATRDSYDFNYFGEQFVNMRKNILINGVSLYDINTTVDDSAYVYSSDPWMNSTNAPGEGAAYQLFQNPTLIRGAGDTLTIYVHKQYIEDTNAKAIEVTIKEGFTHGDFQQYVVVEDITATVLALPCTVTVRLGGNPMEMGNVYTVEANYGETVTLEAPTAAGKTFTGWVDIEGNAVDASFTVENDTAVYATWEVTPYTLTIVNGETSTDFTFGVEYTDDIMISVNDLAFVLEDNLPENTADCVYSWAEEVPETFELTNYTFTVAAQEILNFFMMGEETTVEIPAGKIAQTYPKMAGDFTFAWAGEAKVFVDGNEIENGAVVSLWNSFIEVKPNDATADCTVVLTLAEYKEPATALVLGENAVNVSVEGYFCAGTEVEFTAAKAGTYVLSVAEGEENADFTLIGESEATWIEVLPYEFELAEGETIKFLVCTTAIMTLTEDEINFVIAEKADEPVIPDSSEDVTSSEESSDVESSDVESSDVESSDVESSDVASDSNVSSDEEPIVAGCFGSVSGLGVAVLGLAAVALFKKKED